jgi:hypothetical protein
MMPGARWSTTSPLGQVPKHLTHSIQVGAYPCRCSWPFARHRHTVGTMALWMQCGWHAEAGQVVRCSEACPLGALAVHSMACSSGTPVHPVVLMPLLLHLWYSVGT